MDKKTSLKGKSDRYRAVVMPYLHAARHAPLLASLLTGDRGHDPWVGASTESYGKQRLHTWGLVARIYREFHFSDWPGEEYQDGMMSVFLEGFIDRLDGRLMLSDVADIVNATWLTYCEVNTDTVKEFKPIKWDSKANAFVEDHNFDGERLRLGIGEIESLDTLTPFLEKLMKERGCP